MQAYFRTGNSNPSFVFNYSVTDVSTWLHVPTQLSPPSVLPRLGFDGGCFEACGEPGPLLKPAVQHGLVLNGELFPKIFRANGWPIPASTGKTNKPIIHDWATAMVQRLFPNLSPDESTKLILQLAGRSPTAVHGCPRAVLAAIQHMDPKDVDNAKEYSDLRQEVEELCMDKIRKQQDQDVRMRVEREIYGVTFTPTQLLPLLPGKGTLQHVYIRRHPLMKRYQGTYPRTTLNKTRTPYSVMIEPER
jgi:hypothetical protein